MKTPQPVFIEVWWLDAWQNDDGSWYWNDRSRWTTLSIPRKIWDMGEEHISKKFREFFTSHGLPAEKFEYDWYSETECEITHSKTNKPLYVLTIQEKKEDVTNG